VNIVLLQAHELDRMVTDANRKLHTKKAKKKSYEERIKSRSNLEETRCNLGSKQWERLDLHTLIEHKQKRFSTPDDLVVPFVY
jgi:hypothetical protein